MRSKCSFFVFLFLLPSRMPTVQVSTMRTELCDDGLMAEAQRAVMMTAAVVASRGDSSRRFRDHPPETTTDFTGIRFTFSGSRKKRHRAENLVAKHSDFRRFVGFVADRNMSGSMLATKLGVHSHPQPQRRFCALGHYIRSRMHALELCSFL